MLDSKQPSLRATARQRVFNACSVIFPSAAMKQIAQKEVGIKAGRVLPE